ncbi:MAG: septum formation initiator family protein [Clostridia bacterium]|nr:septum formation initiator family protein [Clostridia bacterium]
MLKRKPRRSREFKKNDSVTDFDEAREARRQKREKLAEKKHNYKRARVPKEKIKISEDRQKQQRKQNSGRYKVKVRRMRLIFAAIIVLILVVVSFSVINIITLLNEKEERQQEQIRLQEEKARLENRLKNSDSDEYIEQQARSLLKLIMPGETLYVLPEETSQGAVENEQIKE